MADRVTIQDIANELGVSRNTVSKAINNTGLLADATREKVLKKAIEMGYKQFSYMDISSLPESKTTHTPEADKGEIALFTSNFLSNSHFASSMLDKFQSELFNLGYSFAMYRLQENESKDLRLPASYNIERSAGIICIEMFNRKYCSMLCELDIPVLFVDSPVYCIDAPLKADHLYMDNQYSIHNFIREMVRRGKKRIGFIGESMHCQSFFERFLSYRNALYLSGLPCLEEYCITGNKEGAKSPGYDAYREYLMEKLGKLKKLPDVFICANDFIAIDALYVFKKMGISVPQDLYLCGFDGSLESEIVSPSLTTIKIHSQVMGSSAVHLLLSRIKNPSLNFRTIYTETSLIYRESTED